MRSMDVHANNISNVNTYGFKAQMPAFQTLMYGMLDGANGNQLPRGSGSALAMTGSDFSSGPLEQTGRDLDYAIVGDRSPLPETAPSHSPPSRYSRQMTVRRQLRITGRRNPLWRPATISPTERGARCWEQTDIPLR